ncbi:MAG: radical SAM protein [Phycisphaerae bacterium]|nr:radical SAM protein [Phycisphaerae bacterium]
MELPRRPRDDIFTPAGEFRALRARVRQMATGLDIPSVIVYAFDSRTRILPFLFADKMMAPAGVRLIGSTLCDCGLTQNRIVLQQWTPNFRPSLAKIGGRVPEMLLISSMQIHAEKACELIEDACAMPLSDRPLILVGGPKAIYEPWDVFAIGGAPSVSADIAVRGEAFVLAQLLEVLMDYRKSGGTMRQAFEHARRDEALEDVLGLVYQPEDPTRAPGCLVDTGIQRLVDDLDEHPPILKGFHQLETPHRHATLRSKPLEINRVHRYARIVPLEMTKGCKFHCHFCPIPAFNQRTFRTKSGNHLADEMQEISQNLGIRHFFGTCDNFFNDRQRAIDVLTPLSERAWNNKRLKNHVRWGTESTQYDAHKNLDLMILARRSGMRALWFGVEDLTGNLVKKGQDPDSARELFQELDHIGVCPMPMMVHHDNQPLLSRGDLSGLINQVVFLRKAGAISMQITSLTPSVGSRGYEETFESGCVIERVGGTRVKEYQIDGNHVVATNSPSPWTVQMRLLAGYAAFYNPINFLDGCIRPRKRLFLADVGIQAVGMYALAKTAVKFMLWAGKMWWGPVKRSTESPKPSWRLISPDELPKRDASGDQADAAAPIKVRFA